MATLSDDDIEKLFSGAPQYFARSEGHYTGAPHPSVAFPWDESLEIRDLTDHVQIEDAAWSCITAWPHITRDMNSNPAAIKCARERKRAHFYPRCRERPNMLSMQGLEKGTMGYQAALEVPVGDALQEEQFGFGTLGSKANAIIDARQKLLASKDGLRRQEESAILDQLIKNGARYKENRIHRKISHTLYNELFLGILHPPTRVIDHHDPYSLSVQIQALVKVLAAPNVWIDFAHVEWRIRLGQILWGSFEGDEIETDPEVDDAETNEERKEERYWLLLQILLSCELLIRLDAITEGEELGIESIRPAEIHRFEKDANQSVKWSLHLARAWLENIEIVEAKVDPANVGQKRNSGGWLASLTGKMSLHHHNNHANSGESMSIYTIQGRYSERQVNGLTHFARKLRWPDIESDIYAEQIEETVGKVSEATPIHTPAETPLSIDTRRSSYFGGGRAEASVTKHSSGKRGVSAALHPSGWLSKSYVSGLMLPGEGLYHLIMSTLLENDKEAMAKLGPMANLCGGFVYRGKSFWSTACIVGRVLAAGKGSAQCMGWISSDITPQGHGEGWINIDVADVSADMKKTGRQARLWGKTHVERDSCVLGDADPSSVLPADFIIPYENNYSEPPPSLTIDFLSLNLSAPVDSVDTTPTEEFVTPLSDVTRSSEIHTYPSSISFSVGSLGGESKEHNFALSNDIHFVTAHPCAPSSHVKVMRSPSSPTIQQIDVDGTGIGGKSSSPATITGHPLHKMFTYTVIHLSELLEKSTATLDDLLLNTASVRRPSLTPTINTTPRVLVIDCITGITRQPPTQETPTSPILERTANGASLAAAKMHLESRRRQFGSDMEILVRAFCAEKGWNAIISRRRRGCLACAIREAGALAWKVIIRVE
ncbi:hypothetical protein N0V92_010037 [Colletotrichum tropicale]|nr:hypothetical protein N0V92_010037 [Colletotrichum tropicale]